MLDIFGNKKKFAFLATLRVMHCLIATLEGLNLFTNQNRLAFIFDLLSAVSNRSQISMKTFFHCTVRQLQYNNSSVHITEKEGS